MSRRLVFMLMVLVVATCTSTPTPEVVKREVVIEEIVEVTKIVEKEGETIVEEVIVTVTPEPAPQEQAPWDAPYAKVPPDLCPPDAEPVGWPVFDAPAPEPYEGQQVEEVWVQHGLFANEHGELFRMDVIGVTAEAVKLYTEEVYVCLDQVFTAEVTGGETSEPGFDQPSQEFGVNPEDLSIGVYLLGFFDPEEISGEDIISKLFESSAQGWADMLREMKGTPFQARPEEFEREYVVDFVIDPTITNEGTHHYPQRFATKAWVTVSVELGGGSVEAELCRNTESLDARTVKKGYPPESYTLSDDNLGTGATYDLAVKGNPRGTYRVSGRFSWPGWSARYLGPAPCTPGFCLELPPGESATHTVTVTTAETPIPIVDVLLLFDVTYSMKDEIETVKENASYIMEAVRAKVPDAAFGVASLADYPRSYDYAGDTHEYGEPGDYPWSLDLDITTDVDAVQRTLNALGLEQGGDDPECYSRALSEAISVSWRAETKKVIVLFGDSVPHDTEFFQAEFGVDTGVDPGKDEEPGTEDDLIFTQVVDRLKERHIEVIPVNCDPSFTQAVASFGYLAAETGGQVLDLDRATEAPQVVVHGLEAATARIKELTILPDEPFIPWVTAAPPTYDDVGGGESHSFEVTITVPEDASPRLYEFDLTALGDGARLDVFHVVLDVRS